jgi:hypothetical protein
MKFINVNMHSRGRGAHTYIHTYIHSLDPSVIQHLDAKKVMTQ